MAGGELHNCNIKFTQLWNAPEANAFKANDISEFRFYRTAAVNAVDVT